MNLSGGKTTFFGIIFAIASVIAANPYILSPDLSQEHRAWIQTIAGIVVAAAGALGFAAAQNVPTTAQIEEKAVKKEEEKEQIKEEVKHAAVEHVLTVLPQVAAPTVQIVNEPPKAEVVPEPLIKE